MEVIEKELITEDEIDEMLLKRKIQRLNLPMSLPNFQSPQTLQKKNSHKLNDRIETDEIVNIRNIQDDSPVSRIRKEIESLNPYYLNKDKIKEMIDNVRITSDMKTNCLYDLFFKNIYNLLEKDSELNKQSFMNYIYSFERLIHESKNTIANNINTPINNNISYALLTPGTNTNSSKSFFDNIKSPRNDIYNIICDNSPLNTNLNTFSNFYNQYLNLISSPLNINGYSPMILPSSPFTANHGMNERRNFSDFVDLCNNQAKK